MNSKTVATNKKARFDFFLEETFVAGLMLEGWEVKSLREGKLNIKEAYIKDIKGELFLVGARIDPASYINQKDQTEPGRFRKLLLNKRELKNILFAKLEIALAKGKKNIDKKQTKKAADIQRDEERALKKFK
jgi:SsrA-binding protein